MAKIMDTAKQVVTAAAGLIAADKLGIFKYATNAAKFLFEDPELKKKATETLINVVKGGRTRGDESIFYSSLHSVTNIQIRNKDLFLQKHRELLHPDLKGKKGEAKIKLLEQKELAKGLVFLIAEDRVPNDKKHYVFAEKIWYLLFMGIDECPDDNAKLQLLEDRILQFGKNHQDGDTLKTFLHRYRSKLVIYLEQKDLPSKIRTAKDRVNDHLDANADDIENLLERLHQDSARFSRRI